MHSVPAPPPPPHTPRPVPQTAGRAKKLRKRRADLTGEDRRELEEELADLEGRGAPRPPRAAPRLPPSGLRSRRSFRARPTTPGEGACLGKEGKWQKVHSKGHSAFISTSADEGAVGPEKPIFGALVNSSHLWSEVDWFWGWVTFGATWTAPPPKHLQEVVGGGAGFLYHNAPAVLQVQLTHQPRDAPAQGNTSHTLSEVATKDFPRVVSHAE